MVGKAVFTSVRRRQSVRRAVAPIVEQLEGRQLLSGDPLAYQNVVQPLPYSLNFTSAQNGVFDKNGLGTGFTRLQVNKNGTQYNAALINLNTAAGELDITTSGTSTSGSNYGTDNTQVNALETQFDGTTSGFTITAELKGPLSAMNAAYFGGGIYFGPDQDNYVKLVAEYDATKGQTLQFVDEQTATTHTVNTYAGIGSFSNVQVLDLRLRGDAGTGAITASYSLNGGAFQNISGVVTLTGAERAAFFTAAARAGIQTNSKNNLAPITVGFTHFEIDPGTAVAGHPSVAFTAPAPNTTNVSVSQPIEADLNLPNAAIDPTTITAANVYMYRTSDKSLVPAVVNTSGGGDSIILTPTSVLDPNAQYTFVVTNGVLDKTGATMTPFTMSFTTAAVVTQVDPNITFQKVGLPSATGAAYTDVQIGPDHKLYASTEDGRIFRWTINADGTLGAPFISNALQVANGGANRLITGFAFDPHSTASNPILWVSNSFYALSGATTGVDFTGKITVISGANLSNVADAVINLPRSVADHSTEIPVFGPDGALYFAQASNSAYGAPDSTWGNRPEHLLTAAVLRLDVTKITPGSPLDAKTTDAGGTYNPFAAGAPLTIYATGVRNAFDMVWTSDGTLFATNNGSSAGGNAPGYPNAINGPRIDTGMPYSGPNVPALNNIQQTESDYLYKIAQGGYYGHPNPTRGEYVLDGGNPTSGVDPAEFTAYPVGTQPDANYRGFNWDFGPHRSADGIIQYQDMTFGGALQGALLVAEYSAGSDIVVLQRDANGNVVSAIRGINGLTGLNNPVSLVEDPTNGNLYVCELGGFKITLLKPIVPHASVGLSKTMAVFNSIAPGYTGAGASAAQNITITNTGNVPLTFGAGALKIVNDSSSTTLDAARFTITNSASLPASLAPGQSFTLTLKYTASRTGIQYAQLQIASNDPSGPLTVYLRGIGTTGTGGANEPSLPRILRAYGIPTITGDGANDANQNQTFYPATPDASTQEVPMQRLMKAGSGPVTIQLLASFNAAGASNAPLVRFGYYTPASKSGLDRMQLFTLAQADAQTTNPTANGATSFDPGAVEFGLYSIFPHFTDSGQPRVSYSEDALNTWDATVPRKFRFFPLENPDGSVVPNAFVFAAEDNNIPFGSIQPYDSNDVVAIIRNVKAAPGAIGAPAIGVQNLDAAPFSNRMVFNRLQIPNDVQADVVHDTGTLQINNAGDQPLTITALTLSNTSVWTLVNPPALPYSLAPGASLNLTVQFIATKDPSHTDNQTNDTAPANGISATAAGGVWNGTLTIASNDPVNPNKQVQLAGYWQYQSEHENEPGLQTIVNKMFGYGTVISSQYQPNYPQGATTPTYYGEEVVSSFWKQVDPSTPITVMQLASFHQEIDNTTGNFTQASLFWYPQGGTGTRLLQNPIAEGQMIFPQNGFNTGGKIVPANASFSTTSTFGWNLDGNYSEDSRNTVGGGGGHHVRFYPLRDTQGNIIPNAYLMGLDYGSTTFENYDFQDLLYLVTNMRPANAAPTPAAAQATNGPAGVTVQWSKVSDGTLVGYNVYRGGSPTGPWLLLNSAPLTTTSFIDSFAPAGATSYYKITAVDSAGEGVGINASALTPAAAPTGVSATALAATQIKLTWTIPAGAASFRIEREVLGDSNFVEVANGVIGTTYTDFGLIPSTTYVYQIRAENAAGLSAYSTVAFATTKAGAPAPGAPASLGSSLNAAQQIVLNWQASTGTLTGYRVERQGPSDSTFVQIATGITGTSFTDTTASAYTTYLYRVRAENSGLFSAYSNVISATSGLYAPTALTATIPSQGEIDLSWPIPAEPFTSYHIERSAAGGAFTDIGTSLVGTYHDTTVVAGTGYVYRVRVQDNLSFSPYSPTASGTALAGPPAAPATISATANSATQVTITWSASGGADSYWLERMGPGDASFVPIAQTVAGTSFVDSTVVANSSYTYQVRAHNSYGYSGFTIASPVTTPSPSALSSADINLATPGSTNVVTDGKDYDVTAAGTGIYGTADGFRFVYEPIAGNFDISVQITGLSAVSGAFPQAGLVARTTLDAGSPTVALTASPSGGYRFKTRSTAGGSITQTQTGSATFPSVYIRMTRLGNVFTTYYSTNGTAWTQYGQVTLALGNTVLVGMGAMSTTASAATTANFRGFNAIFPPAAPSAPSVNATGPSTINVTWSSVPGAASYNVLRQNPGSATFTSVATGLTTTSFPDSGLAASSTYAYEIVAVNSAGSSAPSASGSATTLASNTAPTAPTNLIATTQTANSITMSWTASTGSVTEYRVERQNPDTTWTQISPPGLTATSFTDTGLTASTLYHYRVYAVNGVGPSGYSNQLDASTSAAAATFASADIGATPAGSTTVVNEGSDYDVTAGGPGVYNTADGFRFLYQQHTGDFDIKVQVASISAAGTYPQGGLMARSTLDAGSQEVSITATSTASAFGIFRFKDRATTNGTTAQTQTGQATFPNVWMRLTRVGNVFTSYYSSDGATWTKAGSVTLSLPSTLYIGLAAASNNTTDATTVQFRNFSEN